MMTLFSLALAQWMSLKALASWLLRLGMVGKSAFMTVYLLLMNPPDLYMMEKHLL
jgi:hypothetical protein